MFHFTSPSVGFFCIILRALLPPSVRQRNCTQFVLSCDSVLSDLSSCVEKREINDRVHTARPHASLAFSGGFLGASIIQITAGLAELS